MCESNRLSYKELLKCSKIHVVWLVLDTSGNICQSFTFGKGIQSYQVQEKKKSEIGSSVSTFSTSTATLVWAGNSFLAVNQGLGLPA